MKKFKKLIPAFCSLLVSAVLLGGSTFAWFSMNSTVTASGMQVTAKANTQYLVISNSTTMGSDVSLTAAKDANYGMNNDGNIGGNYVYPVAYNNSASEITLNVKGATEGKKVPAKGWYTANSTSFSSATGASGEITGFKLLDETVAHGDTNSLAKYALKYTFYVGLADGSDPVTGDLSVTAAFTKDAGAVDEAVAALVIIKPNGDSATEKGRFLFKHSTETTAQEAKDVELSSSAYAIVTVYLFIDGTSTNVTSANGVASLTGKLSLSFTMGGIS